MLSYSYYVLGNVINDAIKLNMFNANKTNKGIYDVNKSLQDKLKDLKNIDIINKENLDENLFQENFFQNKRAGYMQREFLRGLPSVYDISRVVGEHKINKPVHELDKQLIKHDVDLTNETLLMKMVYL
jgi:septation ring formation regulator EzrA